MTDHADFSEVQKTFLEKKAAETSRCADLLFFHAIRADWARFYELGETSASKHPVDLLTYKIFSLGQREEDALRLIEDLQSTPDVPVYLYYSLVKFLLRENNLVNALTVAKNVLEREPSALTAINLVAQFLAQSGQKDTALRVIESSLRLSAEQHDLLMLRHELESGTVPNLGLYLDTVPKLFDVAFYVPVYNGEQYIQDTIESLLGQCFPLKDIIIVDDGSKDTTAEIARRYPVHLIEFGENKGLAAARNAGLAAMTTRFAGSLDADVCADPDYTAHILMEFENGPGTHSGAPMLAGVGGRLIEKHTATAADAWRACRLPQGWYPSRKYFGPYTPGVPDGPQYAFFFLNGCNNIYRRDCILAAGGYDERFKTNAEDCEIASLIRQRGHHLAFTRAAIARHSRRDTNVSVVRTAWQYGFWGRFDAKYYTEAALFLKSLDFNRASFVNAFLNDIKAGNRPFWYTDFLLFFVWSFSDLAVHVEHGHFSPGHAAWIQQCLLEAIKPLDALFLGNLYQRTRNDLSKYLVAAGPVPPEIADSVIAFAHDLVEEYLAIPKNIYEELLKDF